MHADDQPRRRWRLWAGAAPPLPQQSGHDDSIGRTRWTALRPVMWSRAIARTRRFLGHEAARPSTPETKRRPISSDECAGAEVDSHLPAVSQGLGEPSDETQWCINLGAAIRRAKRAHQSHERARGRRRDRDARTDEPETVAALRALVAVLEQPLDAPPPSLRTPTTADDDNLQRFQFTVIDAAARAEFEPWTDGMAVGFRCTRGADDRPEYIYLLPSDGWTGDVGTLSLLRGRTGVPGRDELVHCYLLGLPSPPAADDVTPRPDAA